MILISVFSLTNTLSIKTVFGCGENKNMEFWNRRLLLQNEDVPLSMPPLSHTNTKHATNASSSSSPPQSSSFQFQSPLQVSIRPVFSSSVAYVFLILFTTFFFIGFVFLYFRQFASDAVTFRRLHSPRREEEGEEASAEASAKKCLPVVAHRGGCAECAICLEELREGDEVKVIPYCKHVFHPHCIDTWLDKHVTCPVCRCSELCGAAQQSGEEVGSVSATRQQVEQEVVPIPNLD